MNKAAANKQAKSRDVKLQRSCFESLGIGGKIHEA
jgi:hypothetical protein